MTFPTLVLLLLSAYGLTFSLCDAKVLNVPRNLIIKVKFFDELLRCYFCTGFWSGLLIGSAHFLLIDPSPDTLAAVASIIVFAFASATACWGIELKLTRWQLDNLDV